MVSNSAICDSLNSAWSSTFTFGNGSSTSSDDTPRVLDRLALAHAHADEGVDLVGVVLLVRGQREDVVGADRLVLVVDALDRHLLGPGALELHRDLVADLRLQVGRRLLEEQHAAVGERVEVGVGPQVDRDRVLEVLGRREQLLLVAVGQLEEALTRNSTTDAFGSSSRIWVAMSGREPLVEERVGLTR